MFLSLGNTLHTLWGEQRTVGAYLKSLVGWRDPDGGTQTTAPSTDSSSMSRPTWHFLKINNRFIGP